MFAIKLEETTEKDAINRSLEILKIFPGPT